MKLKKIRPYCFVWLIPALIGQSAVLESSPELKQTNQPNRKAEAELRVRVLSADTQQLTPCTVVLIDANGKTVTESEGFRNGFRSSGAFSKRLPPGLTKLRVMRGPEFNSIKQELNLTANETKSIELVLTRQADLRRRGWYAGDSHVHMVHGEKTINVDFDQVALAARAEDLQYLSLGHAWQMDNPTPERLDAELSRRSTPDCTLVWNVEEPKNYYKGDAGRCLGHCWTLGLRGRTPGGVDVISELLHASAWDYESQKPSFANFESHALIHAQGGIVFYSHPARWWTGAWGGQGGYPKQEKMRVSNMAVELPYDTLAGPTYDGIDVITGGGEFAANQKAFQLWSMLLNHGYRLAVTASSDACFDRPGGAMPGTARIYTYIEGDFSIDKAAKAAIQGRTFATTGPLLLVSVQGQPPGSAFSANGLPHQMNIEAWSSGATTGGLSYVEILRNGLPFQKLSLPDYPTMFRTNITISAAKTCWYCVRAAGSSERLQRAITGAFYFDEKPWRPPQPAKAKIRVTVKDAASGQALEATLAEVYYHGTELKYGAKHRLTGGTSTITIPATARLQAEVKGYEPVVLSPLFDCPSIIETITRLQDNDLIEWSTFEKIQALLQDVELTFLMKTSRF
jgi:hypothetical protein